ncbi:acyl-ACP thioesterase [Neolewinella xylanilytica]|uniref:Acyl-ACP thioesterase n=1 Tax=Neolewinella xylanilytica TaxID=1514080 RepID=A0A2S6I114_9BACT|nr:acyl-ACP thioesterase domain-containing protein [Neolewinella xylanilytica]PPK84654.1 acyl-ACP thioesterase [Neolewinella xylanilytica]
MIAGQEDPHNPRTIDTLPAPPTSPLSETLHDRVAAATVGPHGRLTLPHLIRLFQEAALRNTDRLGISSHALSRDLGLTWVLHRQSIQATEWPALGDAVSVVTLPTFIQRGLITYRDFYLLDAAKRVMACSSSTWSVMDLNSRRIRPIPQRVTDKLQDLPPAGSGLAVPGEKPAPPESPTAERTFRVQFAHLDFNNHLTNPAFPELMLEPLDLPFLSTHLPVRADMIYHREARYGDLLTAVTAKAAHSGHFAHGLYRGEGELLASMATRWTPIV